MLQLSPQNRHFDRSPTSCKTFDMAQQHRFTTADPSAVASEKIAAVLDSINVTYARYDKTSEDWMVLIKRLVS